jgi:hypothetical protein
MATVRRQVTAAFGEVFDMRMVADSGLDSI